MATDSRSTDDIVPTALAVTAMRDNGYKNAAYAVAELMDNSIQAGAEVVELLCADDESLVEQRTRRRLHEIAVLDNGTRHGRRNTQMALQFGNGTRLEEGKKAGMGRFGMGLPSASISQCRRVEVWTWQEGPDERALQLHRSRRGATTATLAEVPAPVTERDPGDLADRPPQDRASTKSGTLVVWSKIDRSMWRTSRALIDNSKELIGRMYRELDQRGQGDDPPCELPRRQPRRDAAGRGGASRTIRCT